MIGPEEITIETPEQIELGLEPVGPGTRFVAWLVDGLIKLAILIPLLLLAMLLGAVSNVPVLKEAGGYTAAIATALSLLVMMGYDVFCEVRYNGQTPGKRLAGARVIRDGGGPV